MTRLKKVLVSALVGLALGASACGGGSAPGVEECRQFIDAIDEQRAADMAHAVEALAELGDAARGLSQQATYILDLGDFNEAADLSDEASGFLFMRALDDMYSRCTKATA